MSRTFDFLFYLKKPKIFKEEVPVKIYLRITIDGNRKPSTQNTTSSKGKVQTKIDSVPVQVNWQGKTKDGKQDSSNSYMKNVPVSKKKKSN